MSAPRNTRRRGEPIERVLDREGAIPMNVRRSRELELGELLEDAHRWAKLETSTEAEVEPYCRAYAYARGWHGEKLEIAIAAHRLAVLLRAFKERDPAAVDPCGSRDRFVYGGRVFGRPAAGCPKCGHPECSPPLCACGATEPAPAPSGPCELGEACSGCAACEPSGEVEQ